MNVPDNEPILVTAEVLGQNRSMDPSDTAVHRTDMPGESNAQVLA